MASPFPVIDLHGLTKEEALAEVDREVNHTFIQETEDRRLEFITGWGDVIRPAIYEYLLESPLVEAISLDGPAIKVSLRGMIFE